MNHSPENSASKPVGLTRVALLSNPNSTGNRALLPGIRAFCNARPELFHYEVDDVSQVGAALASIARARPRILVINGGDGTVQAALTELHNGRYFGENPPPVAVLPNGKTNLIALDLGAQGDPIKALERVLAIADSDMSDHVVRRELIALTQGERLPVIGMFMGGAGLADSILYCRHHIYPLGLPNAISHGLAALAVFVMLLFRVRLPFLPPIPQPLRISLAANAPLSGRYSLLIVTTLDKMLFGSQTESNSHGLKLMMVDQSPLALSRAVFTAFLGKLGVRPVNGVTIAHGDSIEITGERSPVIFDGELFRADSDAPIRLHSTAPMAFVHLAA